MVASKPFSLKNGLIFYLKKNDLFFCHKPPISMVIGYEEAFQRVMTLRSGKKGGESDGLSMQR